MVLCVVPVISSSAGYIWPRYFSNSGLFMDNTSSMYLYVRLNRDATRFFPVESNDCMKYASYEYRKLSARRGAQFVPIGMPTVCWKTFPAKTTKTLSTRNSSILLMLASEYLVFVAPAQQSATYFTKYVSTCPNTKYLHTVTVFENEGVSDNTSESVSQFLVRYGCI